jgi:hypothetical protein
MKLHRIITNILALFHHLSKLFAWWLWSYTLQQFILLDKPGQIMLDKFVKELVLLGMYIK